MKFWLLTSEFPPAYGGGISTYCLETVQMLNEYGHEVTVITQDSNVNELTVLKKPSHTLCLFNPAKYFTSSFLGYEANLSYAFSQVVAELIEKQAPPDIIESQEYMGIAYYLLQFKLLQYPLFKDLKIVITMHAPSFLYLEYNKAPTYQLPYYWIGEMERFCIRAADMLISPSQYLVNELKSFLKLDDKEIHILKNPFKVEKNNITDVKKTYELVFFGKLIPQKGCLELISYFKILWNEGFEHSLTMIGGGQHQYHPEGIDMLDYIKKKYPAEIRTGKLKLLGGIQPEQINSYLSSAHIVLIPSIVDNLPYTVPEAMSRGKVVLASIQGGQSEVIEDGKDGFLFDHTIPEDFSTQLNRVLSLTNSELESIANTAVNKVKRDFSYELIYQKKISLLNSLLLSKTSKKFYPFIRPVIPSHQLDSLPLQKDLLSVVIPYYNMGAYLIDCIQSIKSSTYKNIEIIIVNDGSTGESNLTILDSIAQKYAVKVIHKKNAGLARARNSGAEAAKGEYLAFLDPDDTIEPTYFEKALKPLKVYNNVYFVGCWAKYFDGTEGYWPAFNPEPPYLLVHNMVNSSALVYKTEAFLKTGMNDARMIYGMEDYDSVISMVESGYEGVVLPEALWNYRIRKDSMARAFTKDKQVYLYKIMAEKHKKFYSIFASEVTNLLNANGPGFNYDNPTFFQTPYLNGIFSNKIKSKLISIVKSTPVLRQIGLRLKKHL